MVIINILAYRLPYGGDAGEGFGNSYGALVYPVSAVSLSGGGLANTHLDTFTQPTSTNANGTTVDVPAIYILGKPVHYELTQSQYFAVQQRKGGVIGIYLQSRSAIWTCGRVSGTSRNHG